MATSASDEPASQPAPYLTDEQRLKLVNSVEGMIIRQLARSAIPPREYDDASAYCTLALWERSAGFDPVGPAKFATWAHNVIRKSILKYLDANGRHLPEVGGRTNANTDPGYLDLYPTSQPPPDDEAADRDDNSAIRDDDEQAGDLDRAVRKKLFAETLAVLPPSSRRLVEAIAFEGLTVDQVAEQRGHPYKVVNANLVNAMRTLAAAGKVPAEFARAVGLDLKEMVSRAPANRAKDIKARRELVAECMAMGWTDARIAEGLGYPVGTISHDARAIRKKAAAAKEAARQFWDTYPAADRTAGADAPDHQEPCHA